MEKVKNKGRTITQKWLSPRTGYLLAVLILVISGVFYLTGPKAHATAVSFVCASSAAATSTGACTGEAAGNLLIIMCGENSGGASPTLPSGVTAISGTNLTNSAGSSGTRTGMNVGWTTAASSSSGSGTCGTGTTDTVMMVYSGQSGTPIGANIGTESGNNSGTSVSFNADNLSVTDGSSWFVGLAIRNTADSNMATAPTGMTNRTSDPATPFAAGHDTNGGTSSNWSLTSVTGFGASAKYTSVVLEIEANQTPAAPTLSTPSSGTSGVPVSPIFKLSTTDADSDYLRYEVQVCSNSSCTAVVSTACQFTDATTGCTGSQTGWSGQDQQTSTAYTGSPTLSSSTMATYSYQATALTPSTQYWWRGWAIDPGGSNTTSSASSIQSFTTSAPPNIPTLSTPASGATGVSTTPSFTFSDTDPDLNWSQVGNSLSISSMNVPALAALTTSRIAYIDKNNNLLQTYDFNGTNWSQTGNSLSIATNSNDSIAALSSSRIAFMDSGNQQLRTYDFDGTNWSQTGSSLSIPSGNLSITALSSSRIAFVDSTNLQLRAYDFNGTSWSQTGSSLSISSTVLPVLAGLSSSRIAYLDSSNGVLKAYDFNGTSWSQTGNSLSISGIGSAAISSLTSSRIAFIDSGNQQLRTYDFDGTNWSQTGSNFSISSGTPGLASLSSTEVVFGDTTNQQLRTYSLGDYIQYRLYLYQSDCSTPVGTSPFAESSSQTGWSGQDANGGLAYNSGSTATYAYQGTLSLGTTYCWKVDAKDPSGSNTYGTASSTQSFTTTAPSASNSVIQGGTIIQGGSIVH